MNGVTLYQGFKFDPSHHLPLAEDAVYIYIGLTVYLQRVLQERDARTKKALRWQYIATGGSGYIGSVTVEMRVPRPSRCLLDDLFRGHAAYHTR